MGFTEYSQTPYKKFTIKGHHHSVYTLKAY